MQSARPVKRKTSRGQSVYVEGSAARKLYAVPDEVPKHSPQKRVREQQRPVVRRQTTTLPVSGVSVLILVTATVLTLFICVQYLQLQSELTVRLENINALEVQLNSLVNNNNELDKKLNSFVDLNYIYQVATEELGMRYADQNQITRYTNSGAEYVRQYENIPD